MYFHLLSLDLYLHKIGPLLPFLFSHLNKGGLDLVLNNNQAMGDNIGIFVKKLIFLSILFEATTCTRVVHGSSSISTLVYVLFLSN